MYNMYFSIYCILKGLDFIEGSYMCFVANWWRVRQLIGFWEKNSKEHGHYLCKLVTIPIANRKDRAWFLYLLWNTIGGRFSNNFLELIEQGSSKPLFLYSIHTRHGAITVISEIIYLGSLLCRYWYLACLLELKKPRRPNLRSILGQGTYMSWDMVLYLLC